jgi:hypothetical protein
MAVTSQLNWLGDWPSQNHNISPIGKTNWITISRSRGTARFLNISNPLPVTITQYLYAFE